MVTQTISLIPVGGTDADRVSMAAHLVMFGTAKADLANNTLRVGERSFQLDSLQFDSTTVTTKLTVATPQVSQQASSVNNQQPNNGSTQQPNTGSNSQTSNGSTQQPAK
jgi:hypothetical protein